MNTSDSKTKVAVITGAARGIGLAMARWFLDHNYRVAILDIEAGLLKEAAITLKPQNRVFSLACDVSKPKQVAKTMAAIEKKFGRIDSLVNNAGVAVFKTIEGTSFDEWRYVMDTNLDGPFICTQACVPIMLKNGGGSVVNVTSISGLRASTMRVAYGTSKAALIHLTKQQAVELGTQGIRVNAVSPGPVDTDMAIKVHSKAIRADYHDAIPLNRYGLVDEIAKATGFLCSDDAGYITGQMLAVDGGFDASGIGIPTLRREQKRQLNKP